MRRRKIFSGVSTDTPLVVSDLLAHNGALPTTPLAGSDLLPVGGQGGVNYYLKRIFILQKKKTKADFRLKTNLMNRVWLNYSNLHSVHIFLALNVFLHIFFSHLKPSDNLVFCRGQNIGH
jgi:hypothetical protein